MDKENAIVLFKEKEIRRTWYQDEWWFVIVDVVQALTDSINPSDYIKKMRSRGKELGEGWGQIVTPLSIRTTGGAQKLNCANTEGILRIIQSTPSPKAEPFSCVMPACLLAGIQAAAAWIKKIKTWMPAKRHAGMTPPEKIAPSCAMGID